MWNPSNPNCVPPSPSSASSDPGEARFAWSWLAAGLAVSAVLALSACSSLPSSPSTDERSADERSPSESQPRVAAIQAEPEPIPSASTDVAVESGAKDGATQRAEDDLAIERAIRFQAEGDLEAAIRAIDPSAEGGALDARLARGDAIRFGPMESGRISAAAASYRSVFIDSQASERIRISANYRLHALRMEIHESHPDYASGTPEESGIEQARPVGWQMIKDGLHDEGLQTLLLEAETLSPAAQSALEMIYHPGLTTGPPRHDAKVLEFFSVTADEGFWRSLRFLGKVHANGWGVPASLTKGATMLQEAGERSGSPDPYMDLGALQYENGNLGEAVEAWQRAGELGSADGWYEVGVSWSDIENFERAADAYQKSLDLNPGQQAALVNLALLYEDGLGVPQSDERALSLFREAAIHDSAPAAFMVGQYLLFGRAVEADLEQGRQFLEQSAAAGFPPARMFLSEWDQTSKLPAAWWDR